MLQVWQRTFDGEDYKYDIFAFYQYVLPLLIAFLSVVSKPAAEKNAEIQKRNDAAQELYQNAQKGKVVCVECARVIGADEVCFERVFSFCSSSQFFFLPSSLEWWAGICMERDELPHHVLQVLQVPPVVAKQGRHLDGQWRSHLRGLSQWHI